MSPSLTTPTSLATLWWWREARRRHSRAKSSLVDCWLVRLFDGLQFLDPADEDELDDSEAEGDVEREAAADLTATTRGMLE